MMRTYSHRHSAVSDAPQPVAAIRSVVVRAPRYRGASRVAAVFSVLGA